MGQIAQNVETVKMIQSVMEYKEHAQMGVIWDGDHPSAQVIGI